MHAGRVLDDEEWKTEGEPIFNRLIGGEHPHHWLTDALPNRILLFPWWEPPAPEILGGIVDAAREVGDEALYRVDLLLQQRAFVPLDDLTGFVDRVEDNMWEAGLFSPSGQWAIISSDSDNAVVGATNTAFLDRICERLPTDTTEPAYAVGWRGGRWTLRKTLPSRDQVLAWISYQRTGFASDLNWESSLTQIYGEREAERLLASPPPQEIVVESRPR